MSASFDFLTARLTIAGAVEKADRSEKIKRSGIIAGGTLILERKDEPDRQWGTD